MGQNGGMSSSREPLRLVRGGVAATIATALALIGHVAGGGAMPGWLGIVLPWWLSVTVCTVLAGTRFSLPRMSAAILGSQSLFHGLFMAGTPGDPGMRLVAPPGAHLGHGTHGGHGAHGGHGTHGGQGLSAGDVGSHAGHAGHGSDGVGAAAEHALHGNHSDLQMLLWHVIAAAITTILLHRGETVLFRCFGLAVGLLRFLQRPLLVAPVRRFVLPAPRPALPPTTHLRAMRRAVLSPQLRRGPPLVLAA